MSCGNPHETPCDHIREHCYEYLDGEMTEEECQRIAAHLAECPPCLAEYERDRALKALIRRSCACEPAPTTLRTQIIASFTSIRSEYY
ncbi:mycothiol system anti-sigma-R factor [Arsenicicoccus piscis]|uniref:Putative zinc-finger domain-containing protein n=1 Tax=Arsenicicoccus piscis TaxID=673954 RepID=A0ABQ6HK67_9MICO|nr:mycothiol system anti-sigma-R factor [Arsenicicoccus piscis]MCH8628264.1 mycothiol system anti-sigma-R factor [Arsenicicoccus piscis]GMA18515.1 hypothetical protein GCM10025862_05360 [Arsenicicoccus piscis]